MALAFSGGLPGWGAGPGATQLAASHFVPDEAVLPAAPPHAPAEAEVPAHAVGASDPGEAARHPPTMHWNGHSEQVWPLADGRSFVVSPWGATWWQVGGQRHRTALDLPGLDPALDAHRLPGDQLLITRPEGGAWLLDLSATQPQLRILSVTEAAPL